MSNRTSSETSPATLPAKLENTELSAERTWLSNERTLMSWVRTATAMISFGFTIFKFFELEAGRSPANRGLITPRGFALIMVGIALASLLLATLQYRTRLRRLSVHLSDKRWSLAQLVAGMIAVFGIIVFVSTIVRG